jgi:D-3-phosphoglycerate dehydrogenase
MPAILPTNHYTGRPLEVIYEELPPGFELLTLDRPGRDAIIERIPDADYLMVGGRTPIDREVLAHARQLKMVQRTGVGLDSLDLDALRERGIPVYVNAGVNSRSVAEHTVMLILAVLRRLPLVDSSVKKGEWRKHELGIQCHDLAEKTVGLVGLGAIGLHVARMLSGFGVRLLYTKRRPLPPEEEAALGLQFCSFDNLLARSDIVSLHCPLTPETRGMIGEVEFQAMKSGAVLINTARGPLVDEYALIHALESGKLHGAGLDVFPNEPVPAESRLRVMPNVVLTPHMGGLTIECFRAMIRGAMQNIAAFHSGNLDAIHDKLLSRP